MTVRADRLITRARIADHGGPARSSFPGSSVRVFVDGLERLEYRIESQLAAAGIHRADLDEPDTRIPFAVWDPMFRRALEQRPMTNASIRLATVTPFGAFPLIDYLIAISQNVGEGLTRLARYLCIAEARFVLRLLEDEDAIRVLIEGLDPPLSAEFAVTLSLLHFRDETEGRFCATYASFCHNPDDVPEMERVLGCRVHAGASWNGWALSRTTAQLPLRRRDPTLSKLLQRQADEAIARLAPTEGVALDERYLTDSPLSIGEVADLLGYLEPAAFNRAFRRWHNEPPQAFRERRRSGHHH
jgi:AraC-like DNA-binding protein